jgi:hypothetical protein
MSTKSPRRAVRTNEPRGQNDTVGAVVACVPVKRASRVGYESVGAIGSGRNVRKSVERSKKWRWRWGRTDEVASEFLKIFKAE